MRSKDKALVVLSGGQDSVTCLAWALNHFATVEAITFNYGQRHDVELRCAAGVCRELGIGQKVVDMTFISSISTSALLFAGDISAAHPDNADLPASFVPNRNTLFLTAAHSWAQSIGAEHVITGVCQTDYSGYPDCREEFLVDLNNVLNLGSDATICFHAPLMHLTKAQTWELADKHGAVDLVVEQSHTCYEGDRDIRWDWGYGCGHCPACNLRRKGWEEWKNV
jgi:7-cyano-7-deazaguanine synthase